MGPVVAFNSKTVNIYAVGDVMSKKGWHLSALGGVGGLHMAFTVSDFGAWKWREGVDNEEKAGMKSNLVVL